MECWLSFCLSHGWRGEQSREEEDGEGRNEGKIGMEEEEEESIARGAERPGEGEQRGGEKTYDRRETLKSG